MESVNQNLCADEFLSSALNSIRTTLYELVEAISDQLQPGEDWMVTEALVDLTNTGRLRFLGKSPLLV